MKLFFVFLILILVAGISGMFVFLNQQKVVFVLTPAMKGTYYIIPEMPLGLLVVLSFFTGLIAGYILSLLARLLR